MLIPQFRRTARSSVQQHYVQAREILDDLLCIQSASSPTRRAYRAVLEVSALNFLLKAEEEQDALVARYRTLLKSLTFPVQILLRSQRLDLQPYLAQVHAQIPCTSEGQAWAELTQGLEDLLTQLGNRRTLLERHCYLVIPAPEVMDMPPGMRLAHKRQQAIQREELVKRVLQDLEIRVEMIQQQLAALGVHTTRLRGAELTSLYQSCLRPEHALAHPLPLAQLAAVGRAPQITFRKRSHSNELSESIPPKWAEQEAGTDAADVPMTAPAEPAPLHHYLCRWRVPSHGHRQARRQRYHWQRRRHRQDRRALALPPPDLLRLADVLAPGSAEEFRDAVCLDGEWVRGIAVTAFPREVSTGAWLAPLMMHDDTLEIVFHLHPQEQARVMRQLKQRRAGYASTRVFNRRQGRLDDPEMDIAQQDVTRLIRLLASGEERLFEVSLLLLVRAHTREELDSRTERVLALLQTVFLDAVAHPTTFEHAPAFRSFLPEGRDELQRTMLLDSTSLATTFPFISNALTMPGGAFLGVTGTGDPVLLNPWDASLENPHVFVGGVTGAGKSYLGKLWLLRSLLVNGPQGERCSVIDPDGEYSLLAHALGGAVMRIAPGSAHHLNPFDLLPPGCTLSTYLEVVKGSDRLAEKIQDLQSLLSLMLADAGQALGMQEKAVLDAALYETYRQMGISADPRTHYRQPPLLRDLYDVLKSGVCGDDAFDLSLRLSRYVEGSLAGLFSRDTNVPLDSHLLVWDIRDMRGDLRPIGIFLIADAIWSQALYQSQIRRCLSIDEAASIVEHPEGGRFLANLSRRARKRYLRLVVMTQNPEQFVQDESGGVVAANAAIKVLKLQDRTSVQAVAHRFGLTQSEAQRLLAFSVQEALVLAGDRRVLLQVDASAQEHRLITTNPVELASTAARPLLPLPVGMSSVDQPTVPLTALEAHQVPGRKATGNPASTFTSTYDPEYTFFPTAQEWEDFAR